MKTRANARVCAQSVAPLSGVGFERNATRAVTSSVEAAAFYTPLRGSSDIRKPRSHWRRLPAPPLGSREARGPECMGAHVAALVDGRESEGNVTPIRARAGAV